MKVNRVLVRLFWGGFGALVISIACRGGQAADPTEGKVKLTDPVEKYLPEFRGIMFVAEKDADHVLLRRPKQPITIRNILSHTNGLPLKPLSRIERNRV